MLERILSALADIGIDTYVINEAAVETAELFFVKKALDTRRIKHKQDIIVTVYRDFEENGEKMRGMSEVSIYPVMSDEEIKEELSGAYFAARSVHNKFFELAQPCVREHIDALGDFAAGSCADHALKAARAILDAPGGEAFINSAEVFMRRSRVHIITSRGTDVSYSKGLLSGEYVVQCKTPNDVELHRTFQLDAPDNAQLASQVRDALETVRDRARASEAPTAGEYDVILADRNTSLVLSYYAERACASMIYPGYSNYSVGCSVQEGEVTGERIDMTLLPDAPYSMDGIPMTERELIRAGELKSIFGATRFCRYLGIEPTGMYSKIGCGNGSEAFADMCRRPHLYVVDFSDFQMDSMSGHFGGEIRLGYLFDGEKTTVVTGGSISGLLPACHGKLVFSTEKFSNKSYIGPKYILLPGVSVAGK